MLGRRPGDVLSPQSPHPNPGVQLRGGNRQIRTTGLGRQSRGVASNTSYCPETHLLRNQSIGMILRRTEYSSRLESA